MNDLNRWFPRRGQCQICGVPGMDARHRILDAIREYVAAGETVIEVAEELGLPVEAVHAALVSTSNYESGRIRG
jgi:hypothetical protein